MFPPGYDAPEPPLAARRLRTALLGIVFWVVFSHEPLFRINFETRIPKLDVGYFPKDVMPLDYLSLRLRIALLGTYKKRGGGGVRVKPCLTLFETRESNWELVVGRFRTQGVSPPPESAWHVTKFAPHKAIKLIA